MQNRGMGLSLDPASMNALKPAASRSIRSMRRWRFFDDGRVLSYGSMGGEAQPQVAAQNFIRHARRGLSLTAALDAPRYLFTRNWKAERATVKVENRLDPSIIAGLRKRGHDLEESQHAYADSFGHAGMLSWIQGGPVLADHDPRADGGCRGV